MISTTYRESDATHSVRAYGHFLAAESDALSAWFLCRVGAESVPIQFRLTGCMDTAGSENFPMKSMIYQRIGTTFPALAKSADSDF